MKRLERNNALLLRRDARSFLSSQRSGNQSLSILNVALASFMAHLRSITQMLLSETAIAVNPTC